MPTESWMRNGDGTYIHEIDGVVQPDSNPPPIKIMHEFIYSENGEKVIHTRDGVNQLPAKLPPWTIDSNGRMVYTLTGDRPWEPTLTPGAYRAKQLGCTCSRLDNKWGEGTRLIEDPETGAWVDVEFSIQPGCPLHDLDNNNQDGQEPSPASDPTSLDTRDAGSHSG